MSGFTCSACGRTFGGLTGFDKHQQWGSVQDPVYDEAMRLFCLDPATLTRSNGSHMFKQDDKGRWVLLVGKAHPHA